MNTDMLTCEDALERMSQALDGPLPLEERQALEEHLESCPECRAAYAVLFQMEDALREIGETPAPAELSARVMEQIQAEAARARRPASRWNRAGWRNLAGLAACAVLCLGLWHGAGLGSRENVVDEPSAASQSEGQEDTSSSGLLDEAGARAGGGPRRRPARTGPGGRAGRGGSGGKRNPPCPPVRRRPPPPRLRRSRPQTPAAFWDRRVRRSRRHTPIRPMRTAPALSPRRSRPRSKSRRGSPSPRFRGPPRPARHRRTARIPRSRRMSPRRQPRIREGMPGCRTAWTRPPRFRTPGGRALPWCCPPSLRRRRSFSPPGRSGIRRRTAPAGVP